MNSNALNTSFNKWLQQFDGLTPLMKLLSFLGNEEFFLLLLPLFYLCIHRPLGLRLGAILLFGDALNLIFKIAFALPRPYWIDNGVRALSTDTSFGMPSSHAQNAASIWGFLAQQKRSALGWMGAIVLVASIAISRVFLGVHFAQDVIVGIVIGALWLLIFVKLQTPVLNFWHRQTLEKQVIFSTVLALGSLCLWFVVRHITQTDWTRVSPREFALEASSPRAIVARVGGLWGLLVGAALMARSDVFDTHGTLGIRVGRFVVALLGIGVIWLGLGQVEKLLPATPMLIFRFARYALLTLWVVYFAPRLLMRFGLLTPQNPAVATV